MTLESNNGMREKKENEDEGGTFFLRSVKRKKKKEKEEEKSNVSTTKQKATNDLCDAAARIENRISSAHTDTSKDIFLSSFFVSKKALTFH